MSEPYTDVLTFWFDELTPGDWYRKDPQLDQVIRQRFGPLNRSAASAECFHWRKTIHGRLAEIIVLDQFSRNLFRGRPEAFASDGMALVLAQEARRSGETSRLIPEELAFLYMPFMHSESLLIHEVALTLFGEPGLERNLEFELRHKAIIERFGRYPHRNAALGRENTAEESEFLNTKGSSF
ncbi:MAG: DUF924 domain-containing protein [Proteobacteria bacterium]|jgi:uncharacterized protein (DUF924 family)|nr:DUF924 domain-containing protein [Pseudomonadota bacterium]MDA1299063.1 DUF924 domain-containing protein [Pseudomonadota bacterium]